MQKILAPFPLVRVVVPFAVGIAFGLGGEWNISILVAVFICCLVIAATLSILIRKSSSFYFWHGASTFTFFAVTGILLAAYSLHRQDENAATVQKNVPVMVRIISDPETRESNVRCRARVIVAYADSVPVPTDALTMLYLKRNSASEALKYGDELLVKTGVKNPSPVMNPGEFDYAAWLSSQGIRFVCFAKDQWKLCGHETDSWLKDKALTLRRYFKSRLEAVGLAGQELAVSEALLLGQSSDIDPGLLASYSASGTLHVLSVSGMHVALVFVVLLKLLAPLEKRKRTQWISFAIQFFVIWFYAFMTGMSPSVMRSVMMLSVIITGRVIKRDAHLLNTLAASAIILLVGNPLLLKDAGFLLSYCAVAGIVVAQPVVEQRWIPKSRIIKPVWSLISVTLAAQVFTFPLGLYFFQQFPTWFVLSNLIVIPLSTICLYAGLFLLCISWWTWAATLFAVVFGFLISLLNTSVSFTEFLPVSVLHTSAWNGFEMFLLYTGILCILLMLTYKIRRLVFGSLASLLVLIITIAAGRHHDGPQNDITVFQIREGVAIGIRNADHVLVFTDSATVSKPDLLNYHVFPLYEKSDIRNPDVQRFDQIDSAAFNGVRLYHGWLLASDQKIWLGGKNDTLTAPHVCDALIVHGKNFWMIPAFRLLTPGKIIVTGEVRKKWIGKWKEEAVRRGIPIHITSESGAVSLSDRQ